MRKLLALLMTAAISVSMAACGGAAPASSAAPAPASSTPESKSEAPSSSEAASAAEGESLKGKMLGVVTPSADHGFTAESIKHAEMEVKAMAEKYGFDYKFMTAAESSEQSNAVETILGMNPDCIVLWPITGNELRSAAQAVQDAGVPLIIYDRLIEGFTPTCWIMGDNDKIGEESGTYFNNFFKDDLAKGKVSLLEFKGDSSTVPMQRSNGFQKTADPNFQIVQAFDTGWQRQTAMEQMENFLNTKTPEEIESIKGIFCHDDEPMLGIIDAIKNYNGSAKLDIRLLSGVGGRKENVTIFKDSGVEGLSLMTYTFSPAMIRDAVDKGVEVLQGKTLEDHYLLPTEMVDASNVDAYMQSEEYQTRYSI
ncbi:MAG: sugar ABC transporter substrate-binding protein [Ruminococcaceae bacterium]|nr:sugar ABC transporter substrate-binding protein [Oscillospiraceae bacterium]